MEFISHIGQYQHFNIYIYLGNFILISVTELATVTFHFVSKSALISLVDFIAGGRNKCFWLMFGAEPKLIHYNFGDYLAFSNGDIMTLVSSIISSITNNLNKYWKSVYQGYTFKMKQFQLLIKLHRTVVFHVGLLFYRFAGLYIHTQLQIRTPLFPHSVPYHQ